MQCVDGGKGFGSDGDDCGCTVLYIVERSDLGLLHSISVALRWEAGRLFFTKHSNMGTHLL